MSRVSTVAPIGSGRDYGQDLMRANGFRFLVQGGYVENPVDASLRLALGNAGMSSALMGYSSLDQVEEAVDATHKEPLPPDALGRLHEVWAGFNS